MKNIILQQNIFLQNMAIVPMIIINNSEKEKIKETLRIFLIFFMIRTYKKTFEGMYLLITNKIVINKVEKKQITYH